MTKSMTKIMLFTISLFISGMVFAEQRIATGEDQYKIINQIDKVTRIDNEDGLVIKLIETSAGDPAMNGNVLLLAIREESEEGAFLVWETGIDMLDVQNIESLPHHSFNIEGDENFLDSDGNVNQQTVKFKINYSISNGRLENNIDVNRLK